MENLLMIIKGNISFKQGKNIYIITNRQKKETNLLCFLPRVTVAE